MIGGPEVLYEKGVLKNFAKLTGKHVSQSLSFNKDVAWNFIKKENLAQMFSCEFCEIFKNTFLRKHLLETASTGWLVHLVSHFVLQ